MSLRILAVRRARLFSPGHESDDWLVLQDTAQALAREGHLVRFMTEEEIGDEPPQADVVLNMCQGPEANRRLRRVEDGGPLFVNRPSAALDCLRYRLLPKLSEAGIPIPAWSEIGTDAGLPSGLEAGRQVWIKRADVHATVPEDVVCVRDGAEGRAVLDAFRARGLVRAIVQEHLEGTVVKFYAVNGFFHHLVTAGDPGAAIDLPRLRRRARQCAEALGLDVFGGECVVTEDGRLPVIDVNDWPSFAPCRAAAAEAIAHHVMERARVVA